MRRSRVSYYKIDMYIFDPVQFKEYGHRFIQGDDFWYRCQLTKKLFWKSIYIPFGPACQTEKGFENFIKQIETTRLAKVTIDLPMIYNNKIAQDVIKKLEEKNYKKVPYVFQDEETLLLFKDKFKFDSQKRNSINNGYKATNVVVKSKLSEKEINDIYKIYLESGQRIGYSPKPKDVFLKLSENCLAALALGKETGEVEGYAFGYFMDYGKTNFSEKENNKIFLNMFTGVNAEGRAHKIGHALHYELFKSAFENGADIVDLRGASRTKKRSYIHFKHDFSNDFFDLPGSFTKIYL